MNLFLAFLLNVVVNSFLMYLTVYLIIEFFIFLLRVKNLRLRIFARTIPFIKLICDLFMYEFHNWALAQNVNPLVLDKGSSSLTITIGPLSTNFGLFTNTPSSYSFGDLFYITIGHHITQIALAFFLIIILIKFIFLLLRKSEAYLNYLPNQLQITNPLLQKKLKKHKIQIVLTDSFHTPYVSGLRSPKIYFPENLLRTLNQQEIEAIIVHETTHVCNKDLHYLFYIQVLTCIFWWIPKNLLLNKIYFDQELLADSKMKEYQLENLTLVTALHKTIIYAKKPPGYAFQSGSIKTRINLLFLKHNKQYLRPLIFLILSLSILGGKIWLF